MTNPTNDNAGGGRRARLTAEEQAVLDLALQEYGKLYIQRLMTPKLDKAAFNLVLRDYLRVITPELLFITAAGRSALAGETATAEDYEPTAEEQAAAARVYTHIRQGCLHLRQALRAAGPHARVFRDEGLQCGQLPVDQSPVCDQTTAGHAPLPRAGHQGDEAPISGRHSNRLVRCRLVPPRFQPAPRE